MTRLVLGTAQFGGAYGITNALGRLGDDEVRSVLTLARDSGIDTLDTAADYGDSQQRIGALAPDSFRCVTKFSLPTAGEPVDAAAIYSRSLSTLGGITLAGVMFHRMADLTDARVVEAVAVLRDARASGAVERIGVSVYDVADLEFALSVFPDLDLVQFPGNMVDGRMLDHPLVAALHERGTELHARSAFLQGILLADPSSLSGYFAPLRPVLETLAARAAAGSTTVLGILIRYLRNHPVVDGVVVGATTAAELRAIVTEWNQAGTPNEALTATLSWELLDPRSWPKP